MSTRRSIHQDNGRLRSPGTGKLLGQLTALAAVLVSHVSAQATVDISLKLDTHFGHNSNLFRVDQPSSSDAAPANTSTVNVLATAVQSQTTDMGIGLPLGSGHTRLILTMSIARVDYRAKPELNHRPRSATASLPWRFTDMLEGELSAGRAQTAYAFDDIYPQPDTVERNWTQAAIQLQVTPSVSFPVQISRQSLSHRDQITHALLDSEQRRTSTGVMYQSPTGSSAHWGVARAETRYPGRERAASGSQFQEADTDVFLDVNWIYSPKTRFDMKWANRQRTFNPGNTSARMDLYRLGVTHTFSPFLRMDAQYWHQPVATTDTGLLNAQSTGHRIGLSYTPHEKWAVNVAWLKDAQYDKALDAATVAIPLNPATSTYTVRAQYNLAQKLSVYLDASAEKRTRRQTDTASQNVVRLGLEYRFENIPGAEIRTRAAAVPSF